MGDLDVVYPVKSDVKYAELRYSLRALQANVPHGRVWLVGSRPNWSQHVDFIDAGRGKDKWRNIVSAIRAACENKQVSERFIYMNDDFMVLKPITEIPVLHRGSVYELPGYVKASTTWNKGHREIARMLRHMGLQGPLLSYELHVPMVFDKALMLEALDLAAPYHAKCLQYRTLYGNLCDIGGTKVEDVKPGSSGRAKLDGTFLSTSNIMFTARHSRVVSYLKEAFPTPSIYEKAHA